jgi:flagellar motor switch protein FliN
VNILEPSAFASEFVEEWGRSFSQILSQVGVASPGVENLDARTCASVISHLGAKIKAVTISGGGRLNGLTIVASEKEMLQLGQALMSEAMNPSAEFSEKYRNAAAELVRQAAEHVRSLSESGEGEKIEVSFSVPEKSESGAICGGLRISQAKFPAVTVILVASPELADSFRAMAEVQESHPNSAGASSVAIPASGNLPLEPASNLDMLFDVKLDATIRFGERQLLLRDVLQMGPGSVIELDRQITEPADLLVAGRLVARGEVVVVNGSFGLRVTELVSSGQSANYFPA